MMKMRGVFFNRSHIVCRHKRTALIEHSNHIYSHYSLVVGWGREVFKTSVPTFRSEVGRPLFKDRDGRSEAALLTNTRILIYCTSNERQYLSLSIDVFNSQNIYECKKMYTKKPNFGIYFSIVHISLNFALRNVKFLVAIVDIYLEGTVSQNFDICLSFCLMPKNGQLFNYFLNIFFQNLIKTKLGTIKKI